MTSFRFHLQAKLILIVVYNFNGNLQIRSFIIYQWFFWHKYKRLTQVKYNTTEKNLYLHKVKYGSKYGMMTYRMTELLSKFYFYTT